MNTQELREGILHECLIKEDTLFASGEPADNKLDIERLDSNSDFTSEVVRRLGRKVLEEAPDFVVGVPNGANWLAKEVKELTPKLNLVVLNKDLDGNISFADKRSGYIALHGFRGVIVEDVFNRFTSTRKVLDLEPLGSKIVSAVSVWDRGNPADRTELEIPHTSLVTEYIPEQLGSHSELWKYTT